MTRTAIDVARAQAALERAGVLYYQESNTPFGPYPYPLEMRFGVRSVTKSVGAPLARVMDDCAALLAHAAQQ